MSARRCVYCGGGSTVWRGLKIDRVTPDGERVYRCMNDAGCSWREARASLRSETPTCIACGRSSARWSEFRRLADGSRICKDFSACSTRALLRGSVA